MTEFLGCPFCGCPMEIHPVFYPDGSKYIELIGWHDLNCPLDHTLWCFDIEEDSWTEKAVIEI